MFEDFATSPKNMSTLDAMQHLDTSLRRPGPDPDELELRETWPFGGKSSTVSRAAEAATGFLRNLATRGDESESPRRNMRSG